LFGERLLRHTPRYITTIVFHFIMHLNGNSLKGNILIPYVAVSSILVFWHIFSWGTSRVKCRYLAYYGCHISRDIDILNIILEDQKVIYS